MGCWLYILLLHSMLNFWGCFTAGDIHALYIKAMYTNALGDGELFNETWSQLRLSSPSASRNLERSITEVEGAFQRNFSYSLPDGFQPSDSPSFGIVIFGAPVNADGTPGPLLQSRIDKALEIYKQLPNAHFICSGGAVYTAHPESLAMRDALIANGVRENYISVDMAARDTVGNAMNVALILQTQRLENIILVTNDFHIYRSYLIFFGELRKQSLAVAITPVAAPQTQYVGQSYTKRMVVERNAGFRDSSRANALFEYCDF